MLGQASLYDLYDTVQDMIFVADYATLQVLYANHAAQTITGYRLDELLDLTLSCLFPGLNSTNLHDESNHLGTTPRVHHGEALQVREGSSILTEIRINAAILNNVKCLVCMAVDLREQRIYKQRFEESQVLYHSLVDAVPDLLFRIRYDGTYLDYKVPEGLGLIVPKQADIVGKKVTDIVPKHVADLAMPAIEHVLQTRQIEVIEYTIQEPSGLHYYEARFVPSVEGEVIAVVHDITRIKQSELALREGEKMMQALLNASTDLAFMVDRGWIIQAANEVAARRFGKTVAEWVGTYGLEYLPPNVASRRKTIGDEVFHTGNAVMFEDINQGTHFINTIYPIFDTTGKVSRLAIFARDVTEQKQNEGALRRQRTLLQGVASATNRLLAARDYTIAINEALAILGDAAAVDRVFIFESHLHPRTGERVLSYRFEWTSRFVHSEIDTSFLENLKWETFGLAGWYDKLAAGEVIVDPTPGPDIESSQTGVVNIRTLLIVPIFTGGELWGCIGFDDRHMKRVWTEEEISVFRTMAASIGAAIGRQRFELRLKQEREIAETLRDIGTVLTSTLKLDEVLGRLLDQAGRVLPYDAANVMLIENGVARIVQSVGYERGGMSTEEVESTSYSISQLPLTQRMIILRVPYVCSDTTADPTWVLMPGFEWVRSWLGIPIVVHDEVVGLFSLDSSQKGFYGPEHLTVIAPFAQQAAIAFENAQLFAEVQGLERVKSQMIRIASHDLRSPLARVQSLAQHLQKQLDSLLTTEQRDHLNKIQEATLDMEQIIADVLSLERIETSIRTSEPINWCDLINRSVSALHFEATAKRHSVRINCPPDLPVVRGDTAQLEHAILNMLQNAIKYTPPGGQIELRAFSKMYGDKPTVAVEVQDNGIGIPAEQQTRLFEPFYRASQAGIEDIPGAGLGLSVVKAAVEYHRGRVYVDSAPGEGSLFGFWVPV